MQRSTGWKWLVVTAAMLGSSLAQALDDVSLRLNWQILGFHAPFYYGVAQGYYKAEGIDLKISEGRGGALTAQAIGAKSDTFGIVDGGTVMVSVTRGVPIKTVMSIMNSGLFAVVSRADANIRTAKDLEGKTIAVTAGDALTQLFPAVMKVNNLKEGSIRFVNVDPAGKVLSVLEKRADALLGSVDAQNFQLEAAKVQPATLSYQDLGVPMVGLTVVAHEDTIKSSPDLIKRFNRATRKAFEAAKADPQAAAKAAVSFKPELDVDVVRRQLEVDLKLLDSANTKGKAIGWGADADWNATLTLLSTYQDVKTTRPGSSFFTNEFLP